MQNITDKNSKSKSLLCCHYDTKENLLVRFLVQVLSEYEQCLECNARKELTDTYTWTVAEKIPSQTCEPILTPDTSLLPLNQLPTVFDQKD